MSLNVVVNHVDEHVQASNSRAAVRLRNRLVTWFYLFFLKVFKIYSDGYFGVTFTSIVSRKSYTQFLVIFQFRHQYDCFAPPGRQNIEKFVEDLKINL